MGMEFLHEHDRSKELTFSDVFLVPRLTEMASRMEVDCKPHSVLPSTIPLIVSNMNAVAGRRMAETVTRRGGLVVLPQDMSLSRVEEIIKNLHTRHELYETPVQLLYSESIQTANALMYKRAHGAIIVVDEQQKPLGIYTEHDGRNRDRYTPLSEVMSKDMITYHETEDIKELFGVMEARRVNVLPIISRDGVLKGIVTKKGLVRSSIYKPAKNEQGKLVTVVAVGINGDVETRIKQLLQFGVDVIVLDTAHGHQKKMVEVVQRARAIVGSSRPLVAGNVVTKEAVRDLCEAGASIVKVGIGPGAMCTTRMMTGIGRPQWSAIYECAQEARARGCEVWADGGIRHPRDIVLSLVAGASHAMFGSLWAGTFESPADIMKDAQGKWYKENFGMASRRAVQGRISDENSFEGYRKQYFEEGISASRMYLKERQESAEDVIDTIMAGVRSACTYTNAKNLEELYRNAVIGVQTAAGYEEGKPVPSSW